MESAFFGATASVVALFVFNFKGEKKMDEMNKIPEEQNIEETTEEVKNQDNYVPENAGESEPVTEIPVPHAPIPRLPFIIGSVVSGVAAIAVTVALILGGGNGNQNNNEKGHEHSFGEWNTVNEPTCLKAGAEERVCECNEKQTRPVAALGHTEIVDSAVSATCTSTGLTEGKHCSVCNKIILPQNETQKVAHTYDNKYDDNCNICGFKRDAECSHIETAIIKGKDSTCTATGLTDGTKCIKCDKIIVAQTIIPLQSHTEIVEPAVEATCTITGLTEGKHCSVCNAIIVPQNTIVRFPIQKLSMKQSKLLAPQQALPKASIALFAMQSSFLKTPLQ